MATLYQQERSPSLTPTEVEGDPEEQEHLRRSPSLVPTEIHMELEESEQLRCSPSLESTVQMDFEELKRSPSLVPTEIHVDLEDLEQLRRSPSLESTVQMDFERLRRSPSLVPTEICYDSWPEPEIAELMQTGYGVKAQDFAYKSGSRPRRPSTVTALPISLAQDEAQPSPIPVQLSDDQQRVNIEAWRRASMDSLPLVWFAAEERAPLVMSRPTTPDQLAPKRQKRSRIGSPVPASPSDVLSLPETPARPVAPPKEPKAPRRGKPLRRTETSLEVELELERTRMYGWRCGRTR
ncbi:hypothetical protein C8J57DRAFT_1309997 [Mycena rebaudengoi]|nr:hypothetical protein C8J57DRAFT_1309997 [Mycena rebaudengoi]